VELSYHHALVLIGADAPTDFLRSLGLRPENDWTSSPVTAAVLALAAPAGVWIIGCKITIPWLLGQPFAGGAGAVPWQALLLLDLRLRRHILGKPSQAGLKYYHLFADVWLVGIIPVTLYPFFGGKVWCRYWCPLAKLMQIFSAAFTRFRVSRFSIYSNEKCIACMECTRNCQVGIDVMNYALKQEPITNANSSCIGCGICVTVCPMGVVSFQSAPAPHLVQITVKAS